MTKRYREVLDRVDTAAEAAPMSGSTGATGGVARAAPVAFRWRGQGYRVLRVLGHWREDPGWWRRPDGQPIRIEQTDLWRVEAGHDAARGVYELVHRDGCWTLDRVWD